MQLDDEETVQLLKAELSVEVQHNKQLIEDKEVLEKALTDERKRQAELEERVVRLEHELSKKEGMWKSTENELRKTIGTLEQQIQLQRRERAALESSPASAFTQMVSSNHSGNIGSTHLISNIVS
jgi:predicted nuclease with TOPRIM domain